MACSIMDSMSFLDIVSDWACDAESPGSSAVESSLCRPLYGLCVDSLSCCSISAGPSSLMD